MPPAACSFDTRGGLHRIDRIPEGYYVLVETETPGGYETAEPVLVQVKKENQVIRYYMENRRRQWYADKTDENGRQIRGARLALYRADENGDFPQRKSFWKIPGRREGKGPIRRMIWQREGSRRGMDQATCVCTGSLL